MSRESSCFRVPNRFVRVSTVLKLRMPQCFHVPAFEPFVFEIFEVCDCSRNHSFFFIFLWWWCDWHSHTLRFKFIDKRWLTLRTCATWQVLRESPPPPPPPCQRNEPRRDHQHPSWCTCLIRVVVLYVFDNKVWHEHQRKRRKTFSNTTYAPALSTVYWDNVWACPLMYKSNPLLCMTEVKSSTSNSSTDWCPNTINQSSLLTLLNVSLNHENCLEQSWEITFWWNWHVPSKSSCPPLSEHVGYIVPQGSYPGSTFQVRVPKRRSSPSRQRPPGLDLLTGMGFPEDKARRALQSSNGDVQQAAIMLSSASLG